jgi:hypothetical protein
VSAVGPSWLLSDSYERGKDLFHIPQDCPLDAQSIIHS